MFSFSITYLNKLKAFVPTFLTIFLLKKKSLLVQTNFPPSLKIQLAIYSVSHRDQTVLLNKCWISISTPQVL